MRNNLFQNIFCNRVSYPRPEWNEISIKSEKHMKYFFEDNMYWLEEIICSMFKFTKIDFLGFEYCVFQKRFDMAFRHGEDIIIVELKHGYGAENKKAYYQLQDYEKLVTQNFVNKVYKVLITTHLTKGIIELFKKEKNKTGIILLQGSDIHNESHLHCIDFSKTKYGFLKEE